MNRNIIILLAGLALLLSACTSPDSGDLTETQVLELPEPAPSPEAAPSPGATPLQTKTAPLTTRWAADVSFDMPLPEYPRPQLKRQNWLNLNGQWQFQSATANEAPPTGQTLDETILVPFAAESALSGIQRFDDHMWYRRIFELPEGWSGQRIQLNFGAVDYESKVWVNGREIGAHKGGFDAFSFDITDALQDGENELIVNVYDPTDDGGQAIGKQWNNPGGIWYTSVTGIWQTVWLEPTPETHISRLDLTPDLGSSSLKVNVEGENLAGQTAQLSVLNSDGAVIAETRGPADQELSISFDEYRLWTPDDPFLYDLVATVGDDTVGSYFGMRSIEVKELGGVPRPVLNGEFVFQMGTLDQGWWPDGLYTAPTDEALAFDLQAHKDFGYNMVRKHIKVEPQRWFYHADRLGLLVWQDMPSMDNKKAPSAAAKEQFEVELRSMIDQHRSSPAVIAWVTLNEGWGQYDQARLADLAKDYDPSRLVNNMSGINCCGALDGGNGDMADYHLYTEPGVPSAEVADGRLRVLGEYGGLGLRIEDHIWTDETRCCYGVVPDRATLNSRYLGQIAVVKSLMINRGLSAAVYTQISDVESEINGLFTYDREVNKMNTQDIKAAHDDLLASSNEEPADITLPLDTFQSFQVTTPEFVGRFIRHLDSLGFTERVTQDSPLLLKEDASFKVVAGLADATCYSLESKNFPGEYLRHRSFRIHLDASDGSDLFEQDATWCALPGLAEGQVSLESFNLPGSFLRHYDAELWLARSGGPLPSDTAVRFDTDISWSVGAAWAP